MLIELPRKCFWTTEGFGEWFPAFIPADCESHLHSAPFGLSAAGGTHSIDFPESIADSDQQGRLVCAIKCSLKKIVTQKVPPSTHSHRQPYVGKAKVSRGSLCFNHKYLWSAIDFIAKRVLLKCFEMHFPKYYSIDLFSKCLSLQKILHLVPKVCLI